jgi:hypothetical protein
MNSLLIKDKIKSVRLGDIKRYEKNNKKHSPEQIERIKKSIDEFGYLQPMVLNKDLVLVVGDCRYLSLQERDEEEIVEYIDASYLDEKQIKRLRIIDNKIASQDYDIDIIKEEALDIYSDMEEIDIDLVSNDLCMDADEIDDMFDIGIDIEKDSDEKPSRSHSENTGQFILKYPMDEYNEVKSACIKIMNGKDIESVSTAIKVAVIEMAKGLPEVNESSGCEDLDNDPFFND